MAALGLVGLGVVMWWYRSLDAYAATPFGSADQKVVEIPAGARTKEVAARLGAAGVISDPLRFEWLARRLKRDRQVKFGEYEFSGAQVPEQILEALALGKVKLHHCTIPEGLRADEIARLLEGCQWGRAAEYLALAGDESFARQLGIVGGHSLEGYLFPDTYSFPKAPKPEAVLRKMVEGFFEAYARAQAGRRPEVLLDVHQTATLASIIEKETGAAQERAHISCVFHNRLRKKMRLETDPTVIYAKILRLGAFDGNIRREDLQYAHPYNTYSVKGLPPGPIANSGAAAIEAALAPLDCQDLYFVACGAGTHQFCPDYDCHLRHVNRCQLGKP
ncbi:MAG: endolytic transglycosylase MltG [Deltaproteobacteria bacterium]|nr:endolytic transglycosylase MltG [Deltaproteobacteria bacterium]